MIKGAIFGSFAAGTQEYIEAKLHPDENGLQSGNKGDSGLADAVRHELSTGEFVGGKSRILKATERVTKLENII